MRRISLLVAALVCGLLAAAAVGHPNASSAAAAAAAPVFASNSPITFDFVAVGARSATSTAAVTNAGTAPMKFRQVVLVDRDAQDFRIVSDTCTGASLAPNASCAVGVSFVPTVAGTRIASLRFTDNTPCQDYINLAGSGTDTAAPAVARSAACSTGVLEALQTTTTVTTTPVTPSAPVKASSVIGLPTTCSSRRTVTVRLAAPKGKTFKSVKVLLHGKTIKTLKGKSIRTKVSLKGLPRGRFTIEIRAVTTDGKSFVRKHYYVTCVASKS